MVKQYHGAAVLYKSSHPKRARQEMLHPNSVAGKVAQVRPFLDLLCLSSSKASSLDPLLFNNGLGEGIL